MTRRLLERDRLALLRPVVGLGRADDGGRLPPDVPRHPPLHDRGRDPRRFRDRDLRRARALDDVLERRRPEPAALQPAPRRRWLERRLQGDGVRDPRLHRLRGRRRRSARRRGTRAARCRARSSARRSRSASSTSSARTPGSSARASTTSSNQATTSADPWRNLGKVFWGGGWVARLPRDLQLDRGELERGRERGDARLLRARPERARAAAARAHAPEVQDAERRDHLDVLFALVLVAAVRLEVGPADRLLTDRDARRAARDPRLHAGLRSAASWLLLGRAARASSTRSCTSCCRSAGSCSSSSRSTTST